MNANQLRALQQIFQSQKAQDDGLISFRAGRLFMDDLTKKVTADTKRGKIKFVRSDQGLLQMQWINRISKKTELELTLFPHSSKWQKVKECTDGRVYVLRMFDSNTRHFFWMQEPKDEKDNEYDEKINKLLKGESINTDNNNNNNNNNNNATNNPLQNNPNIPGGLGFNNNNLLQQQQFLQQQQMLASMFGSNAGQNQNRNQNPAQNQNNQQLNLQQLILNSINAVNNANPNNNNINNNNINNNNNNNNPNANYLQAMQEHLREQQRRQLEELKKEPDLDEILNPNSNKEIVELLDDEKVFNELIEHLPETMRSREDLMEQLHSPEFQASVRRLQTVINGPQMSLILQQMGIQQNNQNQNQNQLSMGVRAFLNAIIEKEKNESKSNDNDIVMKDDNNNNKNNNDKDKDKDNDNNQKNKDEDNDIVMNDKEKEKENEKDKDKDNNNK